jgi:MFS family permease
VLSVLGDQLARLAIAVLVYRQTGSPLAASATYACSYLVWVVGGPFLTVLADRAPRHLIMIASDLARAGLVLLLAIPSVPLPVVFGLLLLSSALAPPFEAARSALVSEVLDGPHYLRGNALMNSVFTAGQALGFVLGGAVIASVGVRAALVLDASSFCLSAALLILAAPRRAAAVQDREQSLWGDTVEGGQLVLRDRRLRYLLLVGVLGLCSVVSAEGLAIPVADDLGGGPVAAGLLTAAIPIGFLLGGVVIVRLEEPRRSTWMRPLLVVTTVPLALSPLVTDLRLLFSLWVLAGAGSAVQILANTAFVVATPNAFRGRAFGVAATAIMAGQGLVLLVAGALAERLDPRWVIAGVAVLFGLLSLSMSDMGVAPAQGNSDIGRESSG